MKNLFTCLFLVCSLNIFAQKVTIDESLEPLGNGYNKAYRIFIPHADIKFAAKKWSEFLKKNNAKVKTSKSGIINAQYTVINGLGPDTIQIYSRLDERAKEGILLSSTFERKGIFLSPSIESSDAKLLSQLLKDWATMVAREALSIDIKAAEKLLSDKMKSQKNLEKDNASLIESNEKMKRNISENERKIKDNSSFIESLKNEVIESGSSLETLKSKLNDL